MSKKILAVALATLILSFVSPAEAQQPKKLPRIGYLSPLSPSAESTRREAFLKGLHDLGYVEGKNIVIEYRYAEGKLDRLSDLAAEMVGLKPDVIVVGGNRFSADVKQATSTIPIVATGGDLVGGGVVASLARPGGNVTGSTSIAPDLSGKRLELLREAVPKASRVAILWYPRPGSNDEKEVKQTEVTGREFGVKVQVLQVRDPNEFQGAFAAMKRENANAFVIVQGSFTLFHRKQLVELAAKNRLPSVCETSEWTVDGCLISYGPDPKHRFYRLAFLVDKILKGAKPADLPVEQPTKFEFIINLKTAKQIGLTIPQSVLYRADRVIK